MDGAMQDRKPHIDEHHLDAVLGRALQLDRDVADFEARWPSPPHSHEALPPFTWAELERQLVDLAPTDTQAEMTRRLIARARRRAAQLPNEMVLRELLGVAAFVLDEPLYRGALDEG